jgi:hypothetical protein
MSSFPAVSLPAATATATTVAGPAARGFGPYSTATSWTSSARHFSPLLMVYSGGSSRPEKLHAVFDDAGVRVPLEIVDLDGARRVELAWRHDTIRRMRTR